MRKFRQVNTHPQITQQMRVRTNIYRSRALYNISYLMYLLLCSNFDVDDAADARAAVLDIRARHISFQCILRLFEGPREPYNHRVFTLNMYSAFGMLFTD